MKITTIKYMERKNLGNYEHEELSAEALIGETEDYVASMLTLKGLVHNTLHGTLNKEITNDGRGKEEVLTANVGAASSDSKSEINGAVAKVPAKAAKEKKIKEKVIEATICNDEDQDNHKQEVAKEKPKKVTKYSSDIPEHKSIFGAYLAKKYGDAWKTAKPVQEIKSFTASLNGQDFIDDQGTVVQSFLDVVSGFFGV